MMVILVFTVSTARIICIFERNGTKSDFVRTGLIAVDHTLNTVHRTLDCSVFIVTDGFSNHFVVQEDFHSS